MPRVKIDYVVSVSSEDPAHPASNLVSGAVGRQRWLCGAGAAEGAVLLQLQRAVTICGVHIGSYQAAFVEVLVGTADRPIDQYEVLVPRCVVAGPAECRRAGPGPGPGAGAERVRSFAAEQLSASARGRRWDRVRLLCSQPYNKHCQFGLSFIHIYEPEAVSTGCTAAEPAPTSAPAPKDTLLSLGTYSSDEDEFRPGALFAKHRQSLQRKDSAPGCSTDSQIRKASAQALKNIPEADTTLKKVPIEKSGEKREQIDPAPPAPPAPPRTPSRRRNSAAGRAERAALHGVVFAMSGFVNPERAALRAAGVALGARYRPDWAPDCTHLVCAFPNTPKLKKVSASAPHAHIVSGAWLRACQRRRRREPEAPHALRPRRASPAPSPAPSSAPSPAPAHSTSVNAEDTDDTDDEIEKVRARCKRPRLGAAPPRAPPRAPPAALSYNDVTFVCDERFKGSVTLSDSEEATEEEGAGEEGVEAARAPLPDFLEGLRFAVAGGAEAEGGGCDAGLLGRYVRAYGGLLLPDSALQQGAAADYVLCAGGAVGAVGAGGAAGGALRVRADWLWRCHELRALAPTRPYELPS